MEAVRDTKLEIYSRLKNSVTGKFPVVAAALASLPEKTVVDGEIVAFNAEGSPNSICFRTTARRTPTSSTSSSTFSCIVGSR